MRIRDNAIFKQDFFFLHISQDMFTRVIITKFNKCFCCACQLFPGPACILEYKFCIWIVFCLNCHVGIKKFSVLPRKSIHFFSLNEPHDCIWLTVKTSRHDSWGLGEQVNEYIDNAKYWKVVVELYVAGWCNWWIW